MAASESAPSIRRNEEPYSSSVPCDVFLNHSLFVAVTRSVLISAGNLEPVHRLERGSPQEGGRSPPRSERRSADSFSNPLLKEKSVQEEDARRTRPRSAAFSASWEHGGNRSRHAGGDWARRSVDVCSRSSSVKHVSHIPVGAL